MCIESEKMLRFTLSLEDAILEKQQRGCQIDPVQSDLINMIKKIHEYHPLKETHLEAYLTKTFQLAMLLHSSRTSRTNVSS